VTHGLWLECVGGPRDGERFPLSTPPEGYQPGWVQYCRTARRGQAMMVTRTREWSFIEERDDADQ